MEFVGRCPYPFIEEASVPYTGGNLAGRWCKVVNLGDGDVSCCLPCPIERWRYSHNFTLDMVSWIGVFLLVLAVVLLTSFMLLPVKTTWRHYLTTSPLIGFMFMAVSFIVPLAPAVDECHDTVTPNDWLSDNYCAVSGSFLLYGVWVVISSCFFRSLSLYIHLCWEVELKKKFMYFALACIFIGSAAMLCVALFVSGVAYQAGKVCNINNYHSRASFWGPLLGISILSLLLQLFIIIHCIHRVLDPYGNPLRFLFTWRRTPARASLELPVGLPQQPSARQVWSRILHILQLQWRAVAIVSLIIFHVVFLRQALLQVGTAAEYSIDRMMPWLGCLMAKRGDSDSCLKYADGLGPSEGMTMAAWTLLSLSGVWGFLCTARWSMVPAWREWLQTKRNTVRRSLTMSPNAVDRARLSDIERVTSDCYTVETLYSPVSESLGKEKQFHMSKIGEDFDFEFELPRSPPPVKKPYY